MRMPPPATAVTVPFSGMSAISYWSPRSTTRTVPSAGTVASLVSAAEGAADGRVVGLRVGVGGRVVCGCFGGGVPAAWRVGMGVGAVDAMATSDGFGVNSGRSGSRASDWRAMNAPARIAKVSPKAPTMSSDWRPITRPGGCCCWQTPTA